jgi:hypothetical protein
MLSTRKPARFLAALSLALWGCRADVPTHAGNDVLAAAQPLRVSTLFRLGDGGAGDTTSLNLVSDIAVDGDGDVYATDFRTGCARRFDSLGNPKAILGGNGKGPGECTSPTYVAVRADTVAVFERGVIHLFVNDRYTRTVPGNVALTRVVDLALTDAGIVVLLRNYHRGVGERDTLVVSPVDRETGELGQPLIALAMPEMYGTNPSWYPLLSPRPRIALLADGGVLYATGGDFVIEAVDANRKRSRFASFDVPRSPVAKDRLERERARLVSDMRRPDLSREVANTPSPEYMPAISGLIVSASGAVALRRADASDKGREESWVLLDAGGTIRGQFRIPRDFQAMSFRDCRLTGVMKDDMDRQSIVQLRIEGQGPC